MKTGLNFLNNLKSQENYFIKNLRGRVSVFLHLTLDILSGFGTLYGSSKKAFSVEKKASLNFKSVPAKHQPYGRARGLMLSVVGGPSPVRWPRQCRKHGEKITKPRMAL